MSKSAHVLALVGGLALATVFAANVEAQGRNSRNDRRGPDRLSGTYNLDRQHSDNPEVVVANATRSMAPRQRDRMYQNLVNRLDSPDAISIDVNGRSVQIMSTHAPELTFDADGRDRVERGPDGRQITTRADVRKNVLTVSTSGNRGSDFTAIFEPIPGGLRVTRRLDNGYDRNTVTVHSVYTRADEHPRWNVYADAPVLLVPDGAVLEARLDRAMSSRTTRDGERFAMTVVGPGPFRGAVIDGSMVRSSGRRGRADMTFDFDHIRFHDGRSSNFEGEIQSARTPDGHEIGVDRSGIGHTDRDSQRAQNGAVGAAFGAIIGAIAGGGKGAVIGAVVGGGAGMLTVQGRDELTLQAGTILTIVAVSPRHDHN